MTRAIAEARVKTDKVDAEVLAQPLVADVARRAHIVRQRTRLKSQIHSIVHRNLVPRRPAADEFGHKGTRWLADQLLPEDEQRAVAALLRQLDLHGSEL